MRLAPFSSGASYGSPLAHEVGLWLQFDVGRQHRWVFCAVSSPVGHAKIDQMSVVTGLDFALVFGLLDGGLPDGMGGV